MLDPMHFDARAEVYERSRPPYPEVLWDRLGSLGLLRPGLRVLELGAGSGQATQRLLAAGSRVTAVEPGPALAARLRERCPTADVVQATAEDAVVVEAAYDLAVAATSIHWMDLDVVLPKVHRALVPGGRFAVWRNAFGDPDVSTPFRDAVAGIVARREPEPERPDPDGLDPAHWARRLTTGGWFRLVETEEFRWTITLTADQIRDLFSTFSNWTQAEADAAGDAVQSLGGQVIEHYRTPLILLTRTDAP